MSFKHALGSLVIVALASTFLHAENDYEFARKLLETELVSTAVVERLMVCCESTPAGVPEARLIKVLLRRAQTVDASRERRRTLLEEALAACREVLAGPKTFRLYSVAETEESSLRRELIKAIMADLRDKPDERKKLGREAAQLLEPTVAAHKAASEAAYPRFKELYDRYLTDADSPHPPGREFLEKLNQAFLAWIGADRQYVASRVEQLECYDDDDPVKKQTARELAEFCSERNAHETLTEWPVIAAWYAFMEGRVWMLARDERKALETWPKLADINLDSLTADQRQQLQQFRKFVLRDVVTLKMNAHKYDDAIGAVRAARADPDFRAIFGEDAGKSLLLDFARALSLKEDSGRPEFEEALRTLQQLGGDESAAGSGSWRAAAALTMAGVLGRARARRVKVSLTAPEWAAAGRGFMLQGEEPYLRFTELSRENKPESKAEFEKSVACQQDAVECFRSAVRVLREPSTPALERLKSEPKAWSDMGLCLLRMRNYYEAVAAFQNLQGVFGPAAREKWAAALLKKPLQPAVKQALSELEPLLKKSDEALRHAFRENLKVHNRPGDVWNAAFEEREGRALNVSPGMQDETALARAQRALAGAQGIVAALAPGISPQAAEKSCERAVRLYRQAAETLLKVTASSSEYESALYNAGTALLLAQELWSAGRFPSRSPEAQAAQARELAQKALEIFQQYSEYAAVTPPERDGAAGQRAEREGGVWLARSSLHDTLREFGQAAAAADKYLKWAEQAPAGVRTAVSTALLIKFRVLLEQAATQPVPAGTALLQQAEAAAMALHAQKPDDEKLQLFLLNALQRRYRQTLYQARDDAAEVNACNGKLAALQERALALRLKCEPEKVLLEDYTSLLARLDAAGEKAKAAELAGTLLAKFDPQNRNAQLPDEPEFWRGLLAKMAGDPEKDLVGVIRYNDLSKWDRCKQDHRLLVDYLFDTRDGRRYPVNDPRRPAGDRFNVDLKKAQAQLDSIKRNYPDCQTFDPLRGENGKSFLALIGDEVDFRRKIEASRELLMSLSLELAQNQPDAALAKHYRQLAKEQIRVAFALGDDSPALKLKIGRLQLLDGECDDAAQAFFDVKAEVPNDSPLYFEAAKLFSIARAKQQRWSEAAEYPEFLCILNVEAKYWPEAKAFLEDCYQHGAPRPAPVKPKN